jgi:hypothetical protein
VEDYPAYPKETIMSSKTYRKLVHEGEYAAEIDVQLIVTDDEWSPYLSLEDVYRLDKVRDALRRGDIDAAARLARVYRLVSVAA